MLKSLQISNFKCFKELSVEGLKRINVLVGTNNSGKTALLEAVHLLTSGDPAASLRELLVRRGLIDIQMERRAVLAVPVHGVTDYETEPPVEVRQLFHRDLTGHASELAIVGKCSDGGKKEAHAFITSTDAIGPNGLRVRYGAKSVDLSPESLSFQNIVNVAGFSGSKSVRYVPVLPLHMETLGTWHNWVQESGEKGKVVDAMNAVAHPGIADIFFAVPGPMRPIPRSIIRVRLSGADSSSGTWPLAALGEGSYRMLAIALAMLSAGKGGVVLVDEIDTGLHYTVLPKMWQAVHEMATQRDVQVFATTHSKDCLEAIVEATRERPELRNDIAVVALDPGYHKGTVYDVDGIKYGLSAGSDIRGYPFTPKATLSKSKPEGPAQSTPSRAKRSKGKEAPVVPVARRKE